MKYAELVCQSNYSFLTGASHPEELVSQAYALGYSAIAITDECSLAGIVKAYTHIKKFKLDIKLLIGAKFTYDDTLNLVMIAPSRKGYAELCRIITNSRSRCKKGEYQLTEWDLSSVKENFVIWFPSGNKNEDEKWQAWLSKLYKNRLFIGLRRLLTPGETPYLKYCEALASRCNISIVACGDILMHCKSRLPLQHTLHAIKTGTQISTLGTNSLSNAENSLRSLSTINKLFASHYIDNSVLIADSCCFCLSELKYEYPSELIPSKMTPASYLRQLVEKGKKLRFGETTPSHISAIIEKEMSLINEMAYEHFFITIYDIVQFAKQQGILYQGRGSAANSVVCYCLEITSVDPKQIDVLFERFISKERKEPPDIDVDFEHQRREEIFQYIYKKYGTKHTAIAATVVTYRLKSAIREVGKALGFNVTQLEFFIKNINRRDTSIDWTSQVIELGLAENSEKAKQFMSLVNQIRSFPRHLSQHVGGFIISSGPLYELVPTENAAMENRTVIQWDKDDLESLELLKVDILALGMLSAIRKSFDAIHKYYGLSTSIADISALGDDPQVYDMIKKADTVGIFQIESRAQMSMLPRLRPATYYDLVIQIAIVRPGPIQGKMVHPFLKRREGLEEIDYPSDDIKGVLERTLGVPIFQEQVIQIAMVAADFSGGEADQLRRSMGKWKYNGEMEQFRNKLIVGMLNKGYSEEFAERLFEQILGFGDYGFPESHSASFAILAYVSAWLKRYFPEVFYCSLLNSYPMGFYSPSQLIQDAQRHNTRVLPVCINNSNWEHMLEKQNNYSYALRLGLRSIKGLSEKAARLISSAKRPFKNIENVKTLGINAKELQALASANVFNHFNSNRFANRWQLLNNHNELELFSYSTSENNYQIQPNKMDELTEDYQALGFSLDLHPLILLESQGKIVKFVKAKDLKNKKHKSVVTVVGLVTGRQSPGSAGGVTFMTLEDQTGSINVVVWRATAQAQKQAFLTSKIVKVTGILEKEKDVIHVIAGKLQDMTKEFEELSISSRDFH
jgi:error-prone DNA polymerase